MIITAVAPAEDKDDNIEKDGNDNDLGIFNRPKSYVKLMSWPMANKDPRSEGKCECQTEQSDQSSTSDESARTIDYLYSVARTGALLMRERSAAHGQSSVNDRLGSE